MIHKGLLGRAVILFAVVIVNLILLATNNPNGYSFTGISLGLLLIWGAETLSNALTYQPKKSQRDYHEERKKKCDKCV